MDNQIKLYYEEHGNKYGDPIIFLNGWGTDHSGLEKHSLIYYKRHYRCIFIDALGCGRSGSYDEKNSKYICEQNADEIIKLIKVLNINNVIIYGNCLGGWIGSLCIMKAPIYFKSLVFIDGFLYFDKEYFLFILPLIRYPLYQFFFQSKLGLNLSNSFVKFSKKVTHDQIIEQKQIDSSVALAYILDLYKMERAGYRMKISTITIPSLFICGESTMSVIQKSQSYWKYNVISSTIESVSDSSHLTVSENPEELNTKILSFLNNIISNKK